MFGARPQEVPGPGAELWQSDHGTQGSETAGHRSGILADYRSAEQLWVNKDFGIQRGKGSRQPPVRNS